MTSLAGQRIAVYARFSTDKQSALSIDDQIAKLARYALERGGQLDEALVFSDAATSGATRPEDRSGFGALLDAVKAQRIDIVLVEDLGRMSRDSEDSARIRKRLAFAGVRLLAVNDGVDTSSEGSEMQADMFAAFKSQQRRDVSKQTRRGLEGRARDGFATGGLPYGYRSVRVAHGSKDAARIEIDDAQADVVRLVFRMHASGHSMQDIAAELNGRNIAQPRRKNRLRGWQISTVRAMLHNPRYIGRWSFGVTRRVENPDTRKRSHRKNDAPSVEQTRPELAIVAPEDWQATRERFARTRLVNTGKRRIPAGMRCEYPLSGLIRCDACGELMTIAGGTKGDRYYVCKATKRGRCNVRGALRERDVMSAVRAGIVRRYGGREGRALIGEVIDEVMREAEPGSGRADVQRALEVTERKLRNLAMLAAEGDAPSTIVATIRELESTRATQVAALRRAAQEATERPLALSVDDVLAGVSEALEGAPAAVREALRGLTGDGFAAAASPEGWVLRGSLRLPPISGGNLVHCGGLLRRLCNEAAVPRSWRLAA